MPSTEATASLEWVRLRLAKLWLGGSGFIIAVLILQSFGTIYEGQREEVWSWALPAFIPTLSLIITVLGANALIKNKQQKPILVRRTFYTISYWLSAFYLVLILITIFAQPIVVALHQ